MVESSGRRVAANAAPKGGHRGVELLPGGNLAILLFAPFGGGAERARCRGWLRGCQRDRRRTSTLATWLGSRTRNKIESRRGRRGWAGGGETSRGVAPLPAFLLTSRSSGEVLFAAINFVAPGPRGKRIHVKFSRASRHHSLALGVGRRNLPFFYEIHPFADRASNAFPGSFPPFEAQADEFHAGHVPRG